MPLFICAFHQTAYSYTKIPCEDRPGFNAVVDKFLPSSSINVKVWILDASNINYNRTLVSLTQNAYYNRSDYYAECTNASFEDIGFEYESSVLSCTNKYRESSSSKEYTQNVSRFPRTIPIQNGLTVALDPIESSEQIFCNLGKKAILTVGKLFTSGTVTSQFTGKSYFSVTTYSMYPFIVEPMGPTMKDYKF